MLKKEHMEILDQLLRSPVLDTQAVNLKEGDFIRFFDYNLCAEGIAQIQTIIRGEPNVMGDEVGPRKILFSSSVMGRDFMMIKPNQYVRKIQYDPNDEEIKAKIQMLWDLRKRAEKEVARQPRTR